MMRPRPYGNNRPMSREDSLRCFKHQESISLNFMNFMYNEIGLIYQKDVFRSNYNIIVPLAIGVERPGVTQSTYFSGTRYTLNRKLFEVGFGINYYPSLRTMANYYIGPAIRYMQYDGQQSYNYSSPSTYPYPYSYQNKTIYKNSTLSRYCISVTNGVIFRTRSRLIINMFGSLGFKNDVVSSLIVDPNTNKEVAAVSSPFSLYFWTGFAVGFTF
jgi:hypothetical protein